MNEVVTNTKKIIIFNKDIACHGVYNAMTSFQGTNCNVVLDVGGCKIPCYDHRIKCSICRVMHHELVLIVEPIDDALEFSVHISYDYFKNLGVIIDETLGTVLCEMAHWMNMYSCDNKTQVTLFNVKLNLQTILDCLKEDNYDKITEKQKQLMIDLLATKYNSITYTYQHKLTDNEKTK